MLRNQNPHVSPRQAVKWALTLWQLGLREFGGVRVEFRPYASFLSTESLEFSVSVKGESYETTVLAGCCLANCEGQMQCHVYTPGLWVTDLYRQVLLELDNEEED